MEEEEVHKVEHLTLGQNLTLPMGPLRFGMPKIEEAGKKRVQIVFRVLEYRITAHIDDLLVYGIWVNPKGVV